MSRTTRQNDIMDKAIQIIAQQGMQELTIKNIAEAVGVTEAALYRHFKSKKAILLAVLEYFHEVSDDLVHRVEQEVTTPFEKVSMFIMKRYELFSSQPDLAKVMFSEVIFEYDEDLSEAMLRIMHQHKVYIEKCLEEAQAQQLCRRDIGNKELFRIIIGPVRLLIIQWCLNRFGFPLIEEGAKLWAAQQVLLCP